MESGRPVKVKPASGGLPTGRIGKLEVTRLICGGNLFSGFAHSGELLYVHGLLQHYFTDDKILDTLQLCEESGINTTILRTDEQIVRVLKRYRKERGGKIQWFAQTYPEPDNLKDNIKLAIDNGAVAAYCMGGVADDTFVKAGKAELIGEVVSFIKQNGLRGGSRIAFYGNGDHFRTAEFRPRLLFQDLQLSWLFHPGHARCGSPDEDYQETLDRL